MTANPVPAMPKAWPPTLLIMHGERDEIIPFRHAGIIHTAAEQAGVPVQLWTHPQGDHNSFLQTIPEARDRLEQFFREALASPDS